MNKLVVMLRGQKESYN